MSDSIRVRFAENLRAGTLPTVRGAAVPTILALLAAVFIPPIYTLLKALLKPTTTAYKNLPGPPRGHIIFGHLREIGKAEHSVIHEQWVEKYGKVMRYTLIHGVSATSKSV